MANRTVVRTVVDWEGLRSGTVVEVPGMRWVVMFVMAEHGYTISMLLGNV